MCNLPLLFSSSPLMHHFKIPVSISIDVAMFENPHLEYPISFMGFQLMELLFHSYRECEPEAAKKFLSLSKNRLEEKIVRSTSHENPIIYCCRKGITLWWWSLNNSPRFFPNSQNLSCRVVTVLSTKNQKNLQKKIWSIFEHSLRNNEPTPSYCCNILHIHVDILNSLVLEDTQWNHSFHILPPSC